MTLITNLLYLVAFLVAALAARQIGDYLTRFGLPKITGYLLTGLMVGAFGVGLVSKDDIEHLLFIDEISLGFIAFAAGSELFLPELRSRLKSIAWVTGSLVVVVFTLTTVAVLLLSDYIPFISDLPLTCWFAVAILMAALLPAISPSSAVALVNELRAKGPFTQVLLGVTVIMDVVVITIFAVSSSLAHALLSEASVNLGFAALLLTELAIAVAAAFVLARLLDALLSAQVGRRFKTVGILLLGYLVFVLSSYLRSYSHEHFAADILVEPLLVCMLASFLVNNRSRYRTEYARILHDVGPAIYVAFFTLTGASLEIGLLLQVWPVALALFATRIVAIFIGSFSGGSLAGDPAAHNRVRWMVFITQAGVALGLAKEVADEFPTLGDSFATLIIAVIVLNQVLGPILFKHAVFRVGEAHTRAETPSFDGVRDVLVLGLRPEALALARQLQKHDWQVRIVCDDVNVVRAYESSGIQVFAANPITVDALLALGAAKAEAIVSLLDDDASYEICQEIYERLGTDILVAYVRDYANVARFLELGILVVEPRTAVVSLLEHYVRSPAGTSLLLGREEGHEVIDLELHNPNLDGIPLRSLRLPLDVLVLSIHRGKQSLVPQGDSQLQLGDKVTLVGSEERLREVALRFDS